LDGAIRSIRSPGERCFERMCSPPDACLEVCRRSRPAVPLDATQEPNLHGVKRFEPRRSWTNGEPIVIRVTANSARIGSVVCSRLQSRASLMNRWRDTYMPCPALKARHQRTRTSPRPSGYDGRPGGSNTRILTIGGTGFIGRYVVGYLVKSGHDVAVFHRGTKETTLPGSVRHLHGDCERLVHFQDEFREFAPDCVVAMALPAGNDRTGRLFVDVFRRIARRAVVITSRDVYRAFGRLHRLETGTPDPVPLTETSPLREKFYPYRGKAVDPMWTDSDDLLVERAVMNEPHFQATVIRLPVIYGPQDEYFHRTFPYLKRMDDGRRAILLDEAHADWKDSRVYVEDAAWAIVLAATDD